MGTKLVIKDADFSTNCVEQGRIKNTQLPIVSSDVNLDKTSANFGNINTGADRRRLHAARPVYLELGDVINFSGLYFGDLSYGLSVDGVMYSASSPLDSTTAEHSMNGDTADYYPYNASGNNTLTWTNNIGSGWFIFAFRCASNPNTSVDASVTDVTYNINL
jgi:hypothetical protein